MKARIFNNLMPFINESWAAEVIGAELNRNNGPDLVSNNYVMEVKFALINNDHTKKKYPLSWTVFEYQLDYNKEKDAYWGLGTYKLNKPVSKIRTENPDRLDELVLSRELWIIPFGWMKQYPSHETSGETELSKWENIFRYPKLKDVPETIKTYPVKKGLVHLTEGVNQNDFTFLETGKKEEYVPF